MSSKQNKQDFNFKLRKEQKHPKFYDQLRPGTNPPVRNPAAQPVLSRSFNLK